MVAELIGDFSKLKRLPMKTFKIALRGLIINVLMSCPVYAFYMNFLHDAPINYFTKQDTEMATTTIYGALENAKDGKKVSWRNSQSGAYGYVIPSNTQKNCRNLKIFNSAQSITSITNYKFCKLNGEWKIIQ